MDSRVEKTKERHDRGYNCAQAVACTYCDLFGADEGEVFRMTEAFGAGMGGMEGTCGAVAGACVVAGLKCSTCNLEKPNSKGVSYKLSRQITEQFLEKNGTLVCKELKGVKSGKAIRSCPDCIRDAAEILEKVLSE